MTALLPVFLLLCLLLGVWKRIPVYDAFLEGAKKGLGTAKNILPALIAMLCAIRAVRACGLMDAFCDGCGPLFLRLGIPEEVIPLMLLRPLSGSASLAMLREILALYGPDSRIGLIASVMMGSSETVFYTCGVYLGAAGVKKSRHIIPAALIAWFLGSIAAAWAIP